MYTFLESQNIEPANSEIGVGFHLDRADSEGYGLPARSTVAIPLTVISSMWGIYTDVLQLHVGIKTFDDFK